MSFARKALEPVKIANRLQTMRYRHLYAHLRRSPHRLPHRPIQSPKHFFLHWQQIDDVTVKRKRSRNFAHPFSTAAQFDALPSPRPAILDGALPHFAKRFFVGAQWRTVIREGQADSAPASQPAGHLHQRQLGPPGDKPSRCKAIRFGQDPGPAGTVEKREIRMARQWRIPIRMIEWIDRLQNEVVQSGL